MRLHRFYCDPEGTALTHSLWLRDERLRRQWLKVLRYGAGQEVVLFDGREHELLYRISEITADAVHLQHVTEFERRLPPRQAFLLWSLLKKDNNDWVLQKATELGISNFVPLLAERSLKTGFDTERARRIIIEAAEQCGRSDIPHVREPISLAEALHEYQAKAALYVCDMQGEEHIAPADKAVGVLIGPEGGWTESEIQAVRNAGCGSLSLGQFTLRAETAAVVAASRLFI